MKTELSRNLSNANEKVQYDTQCKRVLSQKIILAWIIQRTVKEFYGMCIEKIIPCIEGTPDIDEIRVEPGSANEKITGMANEDKIPGEGEIYYDIRFYVYVPLKNEKIRMIMNVEAQKNFYPGYEIVTRGIFYAARMVSAQLGTEFSKSQYDNIRKVYSIWLCMNVPQKIGNAISEYCMEKRDLLPGLPDRPSAYDKISVIVIALNDKEDSSDTFIDMINTLLSPDKSYLEKKKVLEEKYKIPLTGELRKEMDGMCNLSDWVEERGIEKGVLREKTEMVINLLNLRTVSEEDIMNAARLSREELEKIKRKMQE